MLSSDTARRTLGVIRIVNGTAGLLAPEFLLGRLGVDTTTDHSGAYPFRMFGVRTVLIGLDLWLLTGEDLRRATRMAVVIHASDTISAAATTVRGDLPRKQGLVATGISAVNTLLAIAAANVSGYGQPTSRGEPMPGPSFIDKALARVGTKLDQIRGWDRLPLPLALLTLIGLRDELRQANLYDSYEGSPPPAPTRPPAEYLTMRTIDGSYNDLSAPSMGMANTRFGRNVPLSRSQAEKPPELLDPNPRTVSRELLVRHEFKPATTLNILAAAWLQFQIRDWFSHGTDPDRVIEVPPAARRPGPGPDAGPDHPRRPVGDRRTSRRGPS